MCDRIAGYFTSFDASRRNDLPEFFCTHLVFRSACKAVKSIRRLAGKEIVKITRGSIWKMRPAM